ncbi:MAG: caspase family protein [Bacteroidales bacterium]|nr:caspase family protein [Bacteroidales bacterium]
MKKVFRLLLLLILLTPGASAFAKVYLVSVGISDYPGTANDLRLSAGDARAMTRLYQNKSGLVYRMLLNEEATVENIVSTMRRVFVSAGETDIVVFFFSGHGYPGGFRAYNGQLTYTQVRNAMSVSKSRYKMIFADACFAGDIRTGGRTSATTIAAAKRANVLLFLSSRGNEVSYERTSLGNSIFTAYMLKGLKGEADANHDNVITAKELFIYVNGNVSRATSGKQHPVMWGKFEDTMPIMTW